jgi:Domain of unknown function (DUF4129)
MPGQQLAGEREAMTSRQPGTTSPRITERRGTPGAGPPRSWAPVLPVVLLILVGLVGLRGGVAAPRWDGPLRSDSLVVGLALEVVLGVVLGWMIRRRARFLRAARFGGARPDAVPARLRGFLIGLLGAGIMAVAVITDDLDYGHYRQPNSYVPSQCCPPRHHVKPMRNHSSVFRLPLPILYGLLIAVLVAAVLLGIWWSRRARLRSESGAGDFAAGGSEDLEDPEDLREAVGSGRAALRTVDDARAAIIACYVAMEKSLAERGADQKVADTPDELLARATRSGLVRGSASARLTALFYEARFSSHPLGRGQRDAAHDALEELAAVLAEPAQAQAAP